MTTERWQTLLPDMVSKFASRDLHVINGVLRSANAILKRFRCSFFFCVSGYRRPRIRNGAGQANNVVARSPPLLPIVIPHL